MSGIIHKVENALHLNKKHDTTTTHNTDSHLNNSSTTGAYSNDGVAGTHGTGHHTGTGISNSTTTPHNSNIANKLDPRIDTPGTYSNTNSGVAGTHGTGHHTGTVGGISHSTNAGPHDSNFANKADPRVDSDLDSTGNRHGASTRSGAFGGVQGSHATPGSGTAQNTAGPHNSDLLNKMDPRVDADLDGSKTYGGNKTHT